MAQETNMTKSVKQNLSFAIQMAYVTKSLCFLSAPFYLMIIFVLVAGLMIGK